MPLVMSKLGREHDEEGISPPRRVQMGQRDEEGQAPSSSRPNWNRNTTRRGYTPPRCVKTGQRDEEGQAPSPSHPNWNRNTTRRGISPSHRVKMGQRDKEGQAPSSSRLNWNGNTTRRGKPLLVTSKWEQKRNGEGMPSPHCVEMGMTRGGASPLLVSKWKHTHRHPSS